MNPGLSFKAVAYVWGENGVTYIHWNEFALGFSLLRNKQSLGRVENLRECAALP